MGVCSKESKEGEEEEAESESRVMCQRTVELALYGLDAKGPSQGRSVHCGALQKVNDFSSFMAMSSLLREANLIRSRTSDH